MRSNIKLGRISGLEIGLHYSWSSLPCYCMNLRIPWQPRTEDSKSPRLRCSHSVVFHRYRMMLPMQRRNSGL